MGMMTFFPWFTIDGPVTFERYRMFPHKVGEESPFGIPAEIDRIAAPYRMNHVRSVREICVLQIDGKAFDADLNEDERSEVFDLAEILALTALADREYFSHCDYTNRDAYAAIIQGFKAGEKGFAIDARRRDGSTTGYWNDDLFMVLCPPHVSPNKKQKFDASLVNGLLGAYASAKGEKFNWSIFYFNRANTDSNQATVQSEVVQSIAAFEALFQVRTGKEEDLATEFSVCLGSQGENLSLPLPARLQKQEVLRKYPSVRDLWIRDMYRTRNSFAHGGKERRRTPAVWTTQEHLLLSSFIFPVCVKIELEKEGFYKLTDEDLLKIISFDWLLRLENIFEQAPDPEIDAMGLNEVTARAMKTWAWTDSLQKARSARNRDRAIAAFQEK
jgi:hypothetical protein